MMRFTAAVAAVIVALGAAVAAQNVPSQFVVSGKLAEQIQDFNTINLATAERIAEACERLAAAENVGISIDVEMLDGTRLLTLYSGFRNESFPVLRGPGAFTCHVAGLPLRPDTYSMNVFVGSRHGILDFVERAMSFEIAPSDVFGTGRLPERGQGPMLGEYRWTAGEPHLVPHGQ